MQSVRASTNRNWSLSACSTRARPDLPALISDPAQAEQQQGRCDRQDLGDHQDVVNPGLAAHSRRRAPAIDDIAQVVRRDAQQGLVENRLEFGVASANGEVGGGRADGNQVGDRQPLAEQPDDVVASGDQRHHRRVGPPFVDQVHGIQRDADLHHRGLRIALAHLLHAHMAGGNRYALAVEASGALRASLVVRPGDEDVRGGQERAGETQHFLALAAAAHDRQVRLLPGQYADLLGEAATARRDLEMQAGAAGNHVQQVGGDAREGLVGIEEGQRRQVVVDDQPHHRVASDPATLLRRQRDTLARWQGTAADPAPGDAFETVLVDRADGRVDDAQQVRVAATKEEAVAPFQAGIGKPLEPHVAVIGPIDPVVGAEHIVEIQVGMSESHRGNGLVMAAEDHETRPRETLAQFPDMLPGHRHAESGEILRRVALFPHPLEHRQSVTGVGLAEHQGRIARRAVMAAKQVDLSGSERRHGIRMGIEAHDLDAHAEQLPDQRGDVRRYAFVVLVVEPDVEGRGLVQRRAEPQVTLVAQPGPVVLGDRHVLVLDAQLAEQRQGRMRFDGEQASARQQQAEEQQE